MKYLSVGFVEAEIMNVAAAFKIPYFSSDCSGGDGALKGMYMYQ